MDFTYKSYLKLINKLRDKRYEIVTYQNWEQAGRCAILRHDVDNDLQKAAAMAEFEKSIGVHSTYFLLLTSDFYNVFSKESQRLIDKIKWGGHFIGLHFDEVRYPELMGKTEEIKSRILYESTILSEAINDTVKVVSMHRPSKEILDADLRIPDMVNSYGSVFFHDFKYLSDSRRRWREPVEEIIDSSEYERLHILTHPFWYSEEEKTLEKTVSDFVNSANLQRYEQMEDNITDLRSIMKREGVRIC